MRSSTTSTSGSRSRFQSDGTVVPINVRFLMDSLSGVMTLVVTGVGGLIHMYSVGYMGDDEGYPRFMSYLNLFMASMLILVLGSSMPIMFIGWEGVGLCSYLLIGFWYENRDLRGRGSKGVRRQPHRRLRRVDRDVHHRRRGRGLVRVRRDQCQAAVQRRVRTAISQFGLSGLVPSLATVACLFLFLGCTGKSAQIPLYVWLPGRDGRPDPGLGPHPRRHHGHRRRLSLLPALAAVHHVRRRDVGHRVIGTLTALLAASIAVVQREMKKILAYSTVSQLGFMFAAVGVGFFAAGFFHVFTHAFFKACLFLGAGSVMHAVHAHGDADIFKLGGMKKYTPMTRA